MRSDDLLLIAAAAVATGCTSGSAACPPIRSPIRGLPVRSAEEMGPSRSDTVALHLRLAHEELDSGRKLIMDGDQDRARLVLMRSEADANVALNRSREARGQDGGAEICQDELRAIRGSMPSGSTPSVPSVSRLRRRGCDMKPIVVSNT